MAVSPVSSRLDRVGSQGTEVKELQQQLLHLGFDPGPIDGDFGPRTRAAVVAFQQARGLEVDGIAGPQTWGALTTPAPPAGGPQGAFDGGSSLALQSGRAPVSLSVPAAPPANDAERRQRVLDIAQAEVGTREATGNNDGAVLKYPEAFGRGSEAYCADFVSWVMTRSGGHLDQANCDALKADLVSRGQWKGKSSPKPGDIVLFSWNQDGGCDHVGLVKSVNPNGTITTIEGNTDAGDGQGVWERTRTLDTIDGFGNPV